MAVMRRAAGVESRIALAALVLATACAGGRRGETSQEIGELPPVTYVCPMPEHPFVLEDKPGRCAVCGMALVPVRIEQTYSCPNHPAVVSDRPGNCPADGGELQSIVVNLYWTCPDRPGEHLTEPGTCAQGGARTAVRENRAHGNHNPRHGGHFFMAADRWHHMEATYARPGVLRVYVYDNFTSPLASRAFTGRAVTKERVDPQSHAVSELEVADLIPSSDGKTLDALVDVGAFPAKVTVKMAFGPRVPEERFDFVLENYSTAPAAGQPSRPAAAPPASASARLGWRRPA